MLVLGIVSNPSTINRTLNVGVRARAGQPSKPFVRHPGILPNDYMLSQQNWYTPVHHGWIVGQDSFYPQGALGDAATTAAAAATSIMLDADDPNVQTRAMIAELVRAENLKAKMAVVSASAVVLMAIIGVVGFVRSRGENV